jgi:predicted nucleotidyltransferase
VTRSEILKILKKYKDENAEKYNLLAIGLFGSFSLDQGHEDSDVDIIIETSDPDLFKRVHIKDDLENLLNKTVDVVRNREQMNPYLKKHIEKNTIYV